MEVLSLPDTRGALTPSFVWGVSALGSIEITPTTERFLSITLVIEGYKCL